jgi:SAM-dependent methyltransferase
VSDSGGKGRPEQHWDPDRYARNARFVADLGAPLIGLLDPRAHERVLDLGCGDGALTEKLAGQVAAVVAVDSSAEQVAAARDRRIDARVMDGQQLTFTAEFDAVVSNAALHWMLRPDAVIAGVWRALKPGGRFVAEMGGAGNVVLIKAALVAALDRRGLDGAAHVPWYFPTVEEQRGRLERCGFAVREIALIPRPTPLPGDIADWLDTFGEPFLKALPAADRAAAVDEVRAELRPALCDAEGNWSADYVRLRFAADRSGS